MKRYPPYILVILMLVWAGELFAIPYFEVNNKFGVAKLYNPSANFSIQSTDITTSAPGPITGTGFFYERLFFSQFAVGYQYFNNLERNVTATEVGSVISIHDVGVYSALDFKAYLSNHKTGGFKFYLGAGQGTFAVSTEVTTRTTSGGITNNTIEAKIPLTYTSFGMDWFRMYSNIGFRLEGAQVESTYQEYITDYGVQYSYTGMSYLFSFFLLF